MEATGKHDFNADSDEELSFCKGDIIKILNMEEDVNWFKAEYEGNEGFVPSNYIEMKPHHWYIPKTTRAKAEEYLLNKNCDKEYIHREGAFLVRQSETSPGEFSLSVRCGETVQHFKVLRDGAGKYFLWVAKFNSLNALIDYHRKASVSRKGDTKLRDMKMVQAAYDFTRETSTDRDNLYFNEGDRIVVLECINRDWIKGKLIPPKHGRVSEEAGKEIGRFPGAFVVDYIPQKGDVL